VGAATEKARVVRAVCVQRTDSSEASADHSDRSCRRSQMEWSRDEMRKRRLDITGQWIHV